ncbi:MAG: hypothetical protein AAGA58_16210 [Verrucomicrobiota bacterium]
MKKWIRGRPVLLSVVFLALAAPVYLLVPTASYRPNTEALRKNLKCYDISYGYYHGRPGVSLRIHEHSSKGEAIASYRFEKNRFASKGAIEPATIHGKKILLASEARLDGKIDSYLFYQWQNLVFRFASVGDLSETSLPMQSAAEIVFPLRHDRRYIEHPYEPRILDLWNDHLRDRFKSVEEFFAELLDGP